nr:hypothetical protein [Escherichia coli]
MLSSRKIEFLTKREEQCLDYQMKADKRQATVDELLAQINNAKTVKAPRSFGQLFGFFCYCHDDIYVHCKQIYLILLRGNPDGASLCLN